MIRNILATLVAVGSVLVAHTAIAEEIHFNCTSNANGDQYQIVTLDNGGTAVRFQIKATGEIGYLDTGCPREAVFATPIDNGIRYDDYCSDLTTRPLVRIFWKDPFPGGGEGMPGTINYYHNSGLKTLRYSSRVEKTVVVTCQKGNL